MLSPTCAPNRTLRNSRIPSLAARHRKNRKTRHPPRGAKRGAGKCTLRRWLLLWGL